jgi:hypothetical protein
MHRHWRLIALFLMLLPGAPAFERALSAQVRTAATDTVRRPDSLAERRERDRIRQA